MEEAKSEITQVLEELERKGFKCRFVPENEKLKCLETGEAFAPENLTIVSVNRYEGTMDGDDEMVVYGITDGKNTKGVIVDSYGAYAGELAECIVRLKMGTEKTFSAERPLREELS